MKRMLIAVTLAGLSLPAPALAEISPRAGAHDGRITYASYQEGQVYTVPVRVLNITMIELGEGETIRSIAAGDTESFQVEKLEGNNVFTIKPVLDGAQTNVTVETDRRFYFLNVVEGKARPSWSVKFAVQGSARGPTSRSRVAPLPEAPPPKMRYRIISRTKGANFAPIGISDDGAKTYFQIPGAAATPTIFRVDAEGREYAVNSSMDGAVIIVSGRSSRWVVRHGEDHACIEGEGVRP